MVERTFGTLGPWLWYVLIGRPAVPEHLREVAARAAPGVLAGDRLLPVLPALEPLLPRPGLQRGTTVSVARGAGSTSLALAAGASAAGAWCAAVGARSLGLVAAAEAGIALERFPLVGR